MCFQYASDVFVFVRLRFIWIFIYNGNTIINKPKQPEKNFLYSPTSASDGPKRHHHSPPIPSPKFIEEMKIIILNEKTSEKTKSENIAVRTATTKNISI